MLEKPKKKNWLHLKNKSKLLLLFAVLYFIFPLDFIPDILPGIGWGDDLILLLASLIVHYRKNLIKRKKEEEKIIDGEILE